MYPAGVPGVTARRLALSTGVSVRVVEAGPPHGPPVVMLHGWGCSAYVFRHGIQRLATAGFRVLAPELRGFGISDKPSAPGAYTLDAYLDDLVALLDVCSLPATALLGHSMGGAIALRAALKYPDRVTALALVNPVGVAAIPGLALRAVAPLWFVDLLGRRAVPRWAVDFILRRLAYSRAELVSERDVEEYWAPSQFEGYAFALRATLSEFDWEPVPGARLRSGRVKTTVVLGAADRLIRAAASEGALAGAASMEVVTLPGGHCVHEELPDLVYPMVAAALS